MIAMTTRLERLSDVENVHLDSIMTIGDWIKDRKESVD